MLLRPFAFVPFVLALAGYLAPHPAPQIAAVIQPCCVRLPWDGAADDFVLDLRYHVTTDAEGRVSAVGPVKSRSTIEVLEPQRIDACLRSWRLPPAATYEVKILGKIYEPVSYEVWRGTQRVVQVQSSRLCAGPSEPACPHPAGIITATVGLKNAVNPPEVLSRVEPDTSRLTPPVPVGVVILEAGIDRAGIVRSTCVKRSVRPDADRAAAVALLQWKWEPATLKDTGTPIGIVQIVAVRVGGDR